MLSPKHLIPLLLLAIPTQASAEDVVLYSYAKTSQKPADWAIMPVIADLPDTAPVTIFDALKRKKMPTYGSTALSTDKKQVTIDPTKCAYGSIISAEVSSSFKAHGHSVPSFVCDNHPIPAADEALMHYRPVVPLWQALSANAFDGPVLIQMGSDYMDASAFQALVKKQDKSLIKAVEADFDNPNVFVKTGAMKGYMAHKFPGAEKRVAKELTSSTPGNVNAAMTALADSRDPSTIAQMKAVLAKNDAMQEIYALAMLDAADSSLHDAARLILLKSSNDINFDRGLADLDKTPNDEILRDHLDEILDAATPAHAQKLTPRALKQNSSGLQAWLSQTKTSETAQSVALTVLDTANVTDIQMVARSVLLENPTSDIAFDALDTLIKQGAVSSAFWLRGLNSPHIAIQLASAQQLDNSQSIPADALQAWLERASSLENA